MAPQYTIDVIVDLQNDFITGALGTAEAQAIVERAAETAARAAAEGHPLFFTLDTHGPDYLATREGGDLPVPHCLHGTEGHALAPAVAAVAEAEDPACPAKVLVEKDTFGAKALPGKIRDFLAAQGAGDDAIEKFRIYGVLHRYLCDLKRNAAARLLPRSADRDPFFLLRRRYARFPRHRTGSSGGLPVPGAVNFGSM